MIDDSFRLCTESAEIEKIAIKSVVNAESIMREDVMSENMTDDTTTEVQSEALKVRIARGTLLTVARWRQPQYAGLLTNQNTRVALVWGPSYCCGRSFHCTWVVEQPVTNVFPARGQRICL